MRAQLGRELKKQRNQKVDKVLMIHTNFHGVTGRECSFSCHRGTIDLQSKYGRNDKLIHDSDEAEEEVKPMQSLKHKITKQYLEQKKLQTS